MIEPVAARNEDIGGRMRVAERDLRTAKDVSESNADWAFNIGYNAMLQAGTALMLSRGYRPVGEKKHVAVIEFVKSEYAGMIDRQILDTFNNARQKRHRVVYEEVGMVSASEAETVIKHAEQFVDAVKQLLNAN